MNGIRILTNTVESTQNLQGMLDEAVDGYGYELVHSELVGRGKSRVLRLYIDAPGGVDLDDCVFVSKQVSRLLDVEDPLTGSYTLEVSSPGIERPLAKHEHFEQAVGQWVDVSTWIQCDGRKNFLGKLLKVEDNFIVMDIEGVSYKIDIGGIRRARLKPDLGGPD